MPPRSKKLTVTLSIEQGYQLPTFYQKATPREIGEALSRGAVEILTSQDNQTRSSSFLEFQQKSLQEREDQLAKHEETIKKMIEEIRLQSESTRTTLQSRIDELNVNSEEAVEAIARITAERDALLGKGEEVDDTPLQEHMKSLTTHLTEMFELYANHDSLQRQLDASLTAIRVKTMTWYRHMKRSDIASKFRLTLPWEHAYEHAVGRIWNNMTAAKEKELDSNLGRKAAELAIAQEKTQTAADHETKEKRQRTE